MTQKIKTVKEYKRQKESLVLWKSTGILDNISEEDAEILFQKLDELAQYLLNNHVQVFHKYLESVIFIIVRRTFVVYNYLIKDIPIVVGYVNSILYEHYTSDMESECELCDSIAQTIANLKL